jgi:thioesterase domain-containing protein
VGAADAKAEPFFYFHGDLQAGGLYTHALANQLHGRAVFAMHPHMPGGPEDIEQMAAEHVAVIRREQPRGPYLLGGYCNGGVLAFEAARQLQIAGEEVRRLIVVDGQVRNAATSLSGMLRPDGRVGRRLGPLRKPLAMAVRGALMLERTWRWEKLKADTDGASALVVWRVLQRGVGKLVNVSTGRYQPPKAPAITPDGFAAHLSQTEEQQLRNGYHISALDRYVPKRYEGTVTLIIPAERKERLASALARHWGSFARDVRVERVPGDHLTAVTHHVGELGQTIRAVLES